MGFVAKLKRLLLPKQIEYIVERPYDISTAGHIIGLVLLYLIGIPGVAVWVVLTAITEVHTSTSTVLYEETPTWRGGFFNSTSCDPVVLQPGQRFYTSTGVFQYKYVGGADSQVEDQDDDDDKTTPPAQKYSSVRTEG